jgi:hypothetical protein
MLGAEGRTRTGTLLGRQILSLLRLPIPPLRHRMESHVQE